MNATKECVNGSIRKVRRRLTGGMNVGGLTRSGEFDNTKLMQSFRSSFREASGDEGDTVFHDETDQAA